MMKITANGKEVKIKFGYNCFCDSDIMDRVKDMTEMFSGDNEDSAENIGMLKELFTIVRDLIFTGAQKYNPFENEQEVGEFLDEYMDEDTDEERGLLHLFQDLSEELFNEGFLADITEQGETQMQNGAKAPTDHKQKK